MKYNKSIFLLLIAPLFLSGVIKKNEKPGNFSVGNLSGKLSVYEVRFTFTGYIALFGAPSDCQNRGGTVVLAGLLEGAENVPDDDEDITYTGTLQLNINMDVCSIKETGGNPPTVPCSFTVTGSGPVKTRLKISFDGRGAYIQITDTIPALGFSKNVNGSCDPQQMIQQQKLVPIRSIASVFNGLDLPKLQDRTLIAGQTYVDTGETGETVVQVLRKIQ